MNTVFSFNSDELCISVRRLSNNNMAKCHSHSDYEMYFLLEGERCLFVNGEFYPVRAGDIFLIPPELEHRTLDSGSGGYCRLTANIPAHSIPRQLTGDRVYFLSPSERSQKRLYSEAKEITDADLDSAYSSYALLGSVMKMVAVILSESSGDLPAPVPSESLGRISEIVAYIDLHLTEKISLSDISEKFFISEFYLCRLFKEYTGHTIVDYLTEKRIRKAKRLLAETNESISSVWRATGFGSASAFGTAFRRKCGLSAREYRNLARMKS